MPKKWAGPPCTDGPALKAPKGGDLLTICYIPTRLAAEPTMISPVCAPVSASCNTTWIRFTVMPELVTPSPLGICSFSTAKPTPGNSSASSSAWRRRPRSSRS